MSSSSTITDAVTFTVTHARHIAAKVATDLKRLQRFYGAPSDAAINAYEGEIVELLKGGYLGTVTYGFKRDGKWIVPMLKYTARDLTELQGDDDDPGKVRPGADISGASFYSYLTHSSTWNALSLTEREEVQKRLPVQRSTGAEPAMNGYLVPDLTYSAGGRSMGRSSLRSF